ncbi:MAG: GNAT family protein [Saprospiraceae bacterium]
MNLQPSLEDDLITLKPLSMEHYEGLYQVACDPLIWVQHPCSDRYKKEVFHSFFMDSILSKGALVVIEKANVQIIGSTRFKKITNIPDAIEIGWSFLSRDKWGGQFNRSMKSLMINYAFNFFEDVLFYIGKDNIRSQKAAEKIGANRIIEPPLKYLIKW